MSSAIDVADSIRKAVTNSSDAHDLLMTTVEAWAKVTDREFNRSDIGAIFQSFENNMLGMWNSTAAQVARVNPVSDTAHGPSAPTTPPAQERVRVTPASSAKKVPRGTPPPMERILVEPVSSAKKKAQRITSKEIQAAWDDLDSDAEDQRAKKKQKKSK